MLVEVDGDGLRLGKIERDGWRLEEVGWVWFD